MSPSSRVPYAIGVIRYFVANSALLFSYELIYLYIVNHKPSVSYMPH